MSTLLNNVLQVVGNAELPPKKKMNGITMESVNNGM
jgi:hypothetical protein